MTIHKSSLVLWSAVLLLAPFSSGSAFAQNKVEAEPPIQAQENTPVPTTFPAIEIDGAPFDPICFATQMSMESELEHIDLNACESAEIIPGEPFNNDDGTHGITYRYAEEEENGGMSMPYVAYNAIPPANIDDPEFSIVVTWSGGGTGQFSTLYKMRRENDFLLVQNTYAGGDRCNGGIGSAGLDEKGRLSYGINITPYDMLVLGGDPNRAVLDTVEPYDDLDACAACCYGQAHFTEDDFNGITLSESLGEWLDGKYADGEQPSPEQEKQACFDTIIGAEYDAGKTSYSVKEWEDLIRKIEGVCLGKSSLNEE